MHSRIYLLAVFSITLSHLSAKEPKTKPHDVYEDYEEILIRKRENAKKSHLPSKKAQLTVMANDLFIENRQLRDEISILRERNEELELRIERQAYEALREKRSLQREIKLLREECEAVRPSHVHEESNKTLRTARPE